MTQHFATQLLSTVLWMPLIGVVLLAVIPKKMETEIKIGGLIVSLFTFALSIGIVRGFDSTEAGFQFVEHKQWIPTWGINYSLGVDGISLWLVLLTTFITPLVLLSAWNSVSKHVKGYVIAMLALEFGMLGAFLATDLLLFYVFFEVMLIPMYLIIGVWGGPRRIYAAIKFFLFTIAGSLLMLLAILYLVFVVQGGPSFTITDLYGLEMSAREQTLLFFAFALAFAIKVPIFPFHTWLPDAHVEAPTGGSIILAGVLLKLGTYGFLRFVLPFFPDASHEYTWLFALLAVIGIIYGALVAWVQPDMKKLVAYSSVSHLGFCVLGIFAMTQTAVEGSILQMVSHGLSTGALFLLVGIIYDRRHTRMMADFGGLAKSMPIYATIFVIVALSSAGLPGLNGFVGEFMILAGSFKPLPWFTVVAASGVILAALYLLLMVQKVFFGPLDKDENKDLPDIAWNEFFAVAPMLVFIVWIGIYPNTFLKRMEPSVRQLLTQVEAGRSTSRALVANTDSETDTEPEVSGTTESGVAR